MKPSKLASLLVGLIATLANQAAIVVPGADGSDGTLNITQDTVIDLSQAVTAQWDANNAANAGKGVYDPAKWAVVFKYSSVNIAPNATVTFKNHASRAPVVWLVSGNVVVDGTVNLDGAGSVNAPALSEPGPGGFRGGSGYYTDGVSGSSGFGVGGGVIGINAPSDGNSVHGAGGSYGTLTFRGEPTYGNPSLIPLIGGSGGGGGLFSGSGGAGGGSILAACIGEFSIGLNGVVRANGGKGNWHPGGGSGGGVRLVATKVNVSGSIVTLGGGVAGNPGGLGRIRIERVTSSVDPAPISIIPDPSVIDLIDGSTALLWPPAGAPEVRIVSIGSTTAPADPRAEFGTIGADIALPITASTQVVVETKNVEQASQVRIRGTPRSNGNFTEIPATVDTVVSTDPLVILWKADLPVNVGYSAVQVKVVRP